MSLLLFVLLTVLRSYIRSVASKVDALSFVRCRVVDELSRKCARWESILPCVCTPSRFSRRNGQALKTGPLAPPFRMLVVVHPQRSRVTGLGFISNDCVSFVTLYGATQAPFYFDGSPFIVVFLHHIALTGA